MKLHVTTAAASPAGVWQRFAGVAVDHALAAGQEIAAVGVRAVCGDDAIARQVPGLAVAADAASDPVEVLAEFDARTAAWPVWLTAVDAPPLASRGYRRRESSLLRLKSARTNVLDTGGVTVLPGRAARSAVEGWSAERTADDAAAALLPRHLDDPQYESFVALQSGRAIAMAGLQIRGEIGLACDLFVRPEERLRGLASMLLSRVAELASRAQLKDVFAHAPVDDPAAVPTLRRAGFEAVLAFTTWQPPAGR